MWEDSTQGMGLAPMAVLPTRDRELALNWFETALNE